MQEIYLTSDGVEFDKLDYFWVLENGTPLEIRAKDFNKYRHYASFTTRKLLIEHHIRDQEDTLDKLNNRVKQVKLFLKNLKADESITMSLGKSGRKKSEKVGKVRI